MFRWIKKYLLSLQTLKQEKSLQPIRRFINQPELWEFKVDPISKGVAIGLFINFFPIPLQMLWAAFLAIFFRANLPVAIVVTWINNPFTFVGINFLIYKVGTWVMGEKNQTALPDNWYRSIGNFEEFWKAFLLWLNKFGTAYLIGLPIISLGSAFIGYWIVQGAWKGYLWHQTRKKNC